jgi:hypothetical protein
MIRNVDQEGNAINDFYFESSGQKMSLIIELSRIITQEVVISELQIVANIFLITTNRLSVTQMTW